MSQELAEGIEELRRFLRPTFRGWVRRKFFALRSMLFPAKPIPFCRAGDVITIDGHGEFEVGKVVGRTIHLTNGTVITV